MSRVIVFDVNETLLDLSELDPYFERAFAPKSKGREVRGDWFTQMIQSAMVGVITDAYTDFGEVAQAALEMTAEREEVTLSDEDKNAILMGVRKLPPHPEVREALEKLRGGDLRLAALTNSTLEVAQSQLTNAGLAGLFEQILSADSVQQLKPAAEVYKEAAKTLNVETSHMRLVAAHAWDIAGAMRAGCAGAFVARPGKVLDPLAPKPDVVGQDLLEVAHKILEVEA